MMSVAKHAIGMTNDAILARYGPAPLKQVDVSLTTFEVQALLDPSAVDARAVRRAKGKLARALREQR